MATKDTHIPESLITALKADLDAAKVDGNSLKMVAVAMEKSYSWAAEMVRGEQPFPLAKLDVWVRLTGGRHLAGWVANRAGYDLVERDVIDVETTALQAMGESAEALQAASNALSDGVVTEQELAVYDREMRDAIEKFHGLARALKSRIKRQQESTRAKRLELSESTGEPRM